MKNDRTPYLEKLMDLYKKPEASARLQIALSVGCYGYSFGSGLR